MAGARSASGLRLTSGTEALRHGKRLCPRWNPQLEHRPAAGRVQGVHVAAMTLDDRLHDRQTESAAGWNARSRARSVRFVKAIEELRQVFRRSARANIDHENPESSVVIRGVQRDAAAVRRVTD